MIYVQMLRRLLVVACVVSGINMSVTHAGDGHENPRFLLRGEAPDLQLLDLRGQKRGGMLTIQAEVLNKSDKDLQIYWRVRWLDEAGFQIGDGEVWKQVTLLGKQSKPLQAAAVSPKAQDFKIEISAVNER